MKAVIIAQQKSEDDSDFDENTDLDYSTFFPGFDHNNDGSVTWDEVWEVVKE